MLKYVTSVFFFYNISNKAENSFKYLYKTYKKYKILVGIVANPENTLETPGTRQKTHTHTILNGSTLQGTH